MVRPPAHKTKEQTTTTLQRPPQPLPDTDRTWTIGVFLPLSGDYAAIAQHFQRGLELALTSKTTGENYKWSLLLADSDKSTPGDAIKHFKDNHATIILGPIQNKLARVAAEKAIENQLPIILMAPQPQLTNLGKNIFQHFLSAANQAREIARFIQQRDEKKIALIHPNNDFGNDFKTAFINAHLHKENVTIKSYAYNPHETDFSAAIQKLQEPPDPTLEHPIPTYSFTALVLADFYPRLRLLAPQLAFHNLTKSQIYGTRGGNDPRLEKESGRDLEGAIFLDLDLNLPQPPKACIDYQKLYLKTYQEQPSIYDAYAYDTITILNQARKLIHSAKAANFSEALLELFPLKLITGLTTVNHTGEFSKKLYPVIFKDKKRQNALFQQ